MSKDLDKVIAEYNARYQKKTKTNREIVWKMSDHKQRLVPRWLPSGIKVLDEALGGGWPVGCLNVLWGTYGAGKTRAAMSTAATVTQAGDDVLWVDLEKPAFSWDQAIEMGIVPEHLYLIEQLDYAEEMIDLLENILYDRKKKAPTGRTPLIVIDSINNFIGKKEADKLEADGAEGHNMAVNALLQTQLFKRMQGRGYLDSADPDGDKGGTVILAIAHERANMDSMGHGPKTQLAASFAAKHGAKVVAKFGKAQLGTDPLLGHKVTCHITKNHVLGRPAKAEYGVEYGKGVDDTQVLLDTAKAEGYERLVSPKRGLWRLMLPSTDVLVKTPHLEALLFARPDLKQELRDVLKKGKNKTPPTPQDTVIEFDPLAVVQLSTAAPDQNSTPKVEGDSVVE